MVHCYKPPLSKWLTDDDTVQTDFIIQNVSLMDTA
jgi:hypothetical protein